ncbi:MAG: GTPase [Promethearchaeota archaeon]
MKPKPSLLIIGNSNVGKSSITKLLLPNPKKFKGKVGKTPGSSLLIKPIFQNGLPYQIVDLPGFGYMKSPSRRREEHIKKQIVVHIEKNHSNYFLGLVVINILRIKDEINKYFIENKNTIPLSFELINFLKEFEIPLIIIINKIDKVSNSEKNKILSLLINSAEEYGINIVNYNNFNHQVGSDIPLLEISALKRINIDKLRKFIKLYVNK